MLLKVLVKPNKKADKIYWQEDSLFDTEKILIVEVTAPPLDGKANKKVIELVAKFFKVAKSEVAIKKVKTSKSKVLEIDF